MPYRIVFFKTPLIILYSLLVIGTISAQSADELKFYQNNGIQPLTNGTQAGEYGPGSYLVPHDIIIEPGNYMKILPGTTILFCQDAMLVVNGKLICEGEVGAPVLFKRLENMHYYEPLENTLDTRWDGIYLPDSAQIVMHNTIVSDSKYGIVVSGKDATLALDSVLFLNNKFQNIKIGERMMEIKTNSPIVFRHPEQKAVFIPPAPVVNATETIQQRKLSPHKTDYPAFRIAMGTIAGVGLAGSVAGFILYNKYNEEYHFSESDSDRLKSRSQQSAAAAAAGVLLLGIGTAGFTWTFFY